MDRQYAILSLAGSQNPCQAINLRAQIAPASSSNPHNYVAGWWWFPDVLRCQDVEADCLDILIIFFMGIKACDPIPKYAKKLQPLILGFCEKWTESIFSVRFCLNLWEMDSEWTIKDNCLMPCLFLTKSARFQHKTLTLFSHKLSISVNLLLKDL